MLDLFWCRSLLLGWPAAACMEGEKASLESASALRTTCVYVCVCEFVGGGISQNTKNRKARTRGVLF
jgi:hypothetical protein